MGILCETNQTCGVTRTKVWLVQPDRWWGPVGLYAVDKSLLRQAPHWPAVAKALGLRLVERGYNYPCDWYAEPGPLWLLPYVYFWLVDHLYYPGLRQLWLAVPRLFCPEEGYEFQWHRHFRPLRWILGGG